MEDKVTEGLANEPQQQPISPKGLHWSQDFKDKIYDKEEGYRSKIILEINEFAGNDWSAKFSDFDSPGKNKFIVDVTAPSPEFLIRIVHVTVKSFPDLDFKVVQFRKTHL